MTHSRFILFISDLHLDESTPKITKTFDYFLKSIAPTAEALYILGDFFEVYIGDDDPNPFIKTIKKMLREFTTNGPPVYFIPGNRDFLVKEQFCKDTGITLLEDPTTITYHQQKLLLMHGDRLCTDDHSHQRFRRITANVLIQKLFLWMPLSWRQKLANALRKESKNYNQTKPTAIMDVSPTTVKSEMTKHHVKTLIHGHTHRCATHQLSLHGQPAQRIVLDAWHNHGHYLSVTETGKISSITLPFQ